MYITAHALQRAADRCGITESRIRDKALAAMIFGHRENNSFIHDGVVWGFNPALDVLKTVYAEGK